MPRTVLVAIVSGTLLVFAIALLTPKEPRYQGRSYSYWVSGCFGDTPEKRAESREAVKAVGTNGVPFLLTWIQHENRGSLAITLRSLPRRISDSKPFLTTFFRSSQKAEAAAFALGLLGPDIQPAVPQLATIMRNAPGSDTASRAIAVLNRLGPSGFSALEAALADTNYRFRLNILAALTPLSPTGVGTNACLAAVKPMLLDCDQQVRSSATKVINNLSAKSPISASEGSNKKTRL